MKINVKKLNENAVIPTRGSNSAAGYDLYASPLNKCLKIKPGTSIKVETGISMEIPEGYFGAIFARSGLASKQGLRPANCVGVVDSDYRGEIMVALYNDSDEERIINIGDRIAQLVIIPFLQVEFSETETLNETERGEGGFGSTGK